MNYLDAYHLGIDLAKLAGFELKYASRNSETCYYTHPLRAPLLLRLSTHRSKNAPIGLALPVARVTFSPKDIHLSEKRVGGMMRFAIGSYFLNDPRPSVYDGPKKWRTITDGVALREKRE